MKINFLLLCLVASICAIAQNPTNYIPRNVRERVIATMADSTAHIPTGAEASLRSGGSTRAGALFYDSVGTNKGLYVYDSVWQKLMFQASVPVVDSFQKKTPVLGTIADFNVFGDLDDFIDVGTGAGIDANAINFPNGATDFSQYLSLDYVTALSRWTGFIEVVANEKSATSEGFGFGVRSINTTGGSYLVSNIAKFNMTSGSNSGRISFYENSTKKDSTSATLSFSASDTLWFFVDRNLNDYTIRAYNKTTNSTEVVLRRYVIGTDGLHNTGRFSIFPLGGDFSVSKMKIFSNEPKRVKLMFLGDSKAGTYGLTDYDQSMPARMQAYYTSTIAHSGNGDKTAEIIASLDETIALQPESVFMYAVSNDIRNGITSSVYLPNIDTIYARLTQANIYVTFGFFHEATVDHDTVIAHIQDNYADRYINTHDAILYCNECFYTDNVHLSARGHEKAYQTILESGKIPADFRSGSRMNDLSTGQNKAIKSGGNSYGYPFRIGSNDDFDFSIGRNGVTALQARKRDVTRLFIPNTGGTIINAQSPFANGVTMFSGTYSGGTVFNLSLAGADSLNGAGLRLAKHFDVYGTDDFIMYMQPGETTPQLSSYASLLFTDFAGGRIGTFNSSGGAKPVYIDVNLTNKAFVDADKFNFEVPLRLKDVSAPSTPASGYGNVYVNGDSLYFTNDGGGTVNLTRAGSGGGGGSGTVNSGTQYRLAYYAATGTAVSEAAAITGGRALISDANGVPTHATTTATEIGYVNGVTSAIQTQLDGKWSLTGNSVTAGSQFFGSTNNVSVKYITNNTFRGSIDSTGLWRHFGRLNVNSPTDDANAALVVSNVGNNQNSGGAKFIAANGTAFATVGYGGFAGSIGVNISATSGSINMSTASNGNILLNPTGTGNVQVNTTSGTGLSIGNTTFAPTQRLDVDGQVRIRTINSAAAGSVDSVLVAEDGVIKSLVGFFAQGDHSATLTNTTNVTSSTLIRFSYEKVGPKVRFSIVVDVEATAGGNTVLGISIPVASDFTTTAQASGIALDDTELGFITSDATNNRLTLTYPAQGAGTDTFTIEGSYTVL